MKLEASEAGFAMVEALAAAAVAALCGAVLMAAFGSSNGRTAEMRMRYIALHQAQALLDEALSSQLDAALAVKGSSGNLSWTRTVTDTDYPGIESISVDITWKTFRQPHTTHLEGYRVAKG
jgi:hypothetical protein